MRNVRSRFVVLAGGIAEWVLPSLAREIDQGQRSGRAMTIKRAILRSRLWRADRRGDSVAIEQALQAAWRSDVRDGFYAAFAKRFERWFHGPHARIIDALANELAAHPLFDRLVEVGCGDGRALAHLAGRFPGLRELVGLDINASIIARNARVYAERPRLRFVHADARRWLADETRDGTILFSYGGVLEYLSEAELARILMRLGRHHASAVALVEPVDPEHDLVRDARSHVHGAERTFSHNHQALLAAAGFTVRLAKELTVDGVRWLMVLAYTKSASNSV